MPQARPIPLDIPAGVVKTESDRVIEGRWKDSQWMRFVKGRPQKRGGHTVQTAVADIAVGTARALHAWRDLEAQEYIAGGTHTKLLVWDRSFEIHDITPFVATGTLANNPFTTTNTSQIVTVAHTSHSVRSGATVIYAGASAVGGLTLNGTFTVLTTLANSYTFDAGSAATSTATGGGGGGAGGGSATTGAGGGGGGEYIEIIINSPSASYSYAVGPGGAGGAAGSVAGGAGALGIIIVDEYY